MTLYSKEKHNECRALSVIHRKISAVWVLPLTLVIAILLITFSLTAIESGQFGIVVNTDTESIERVIDKPGIYMHIPFFQRIWLIESRWRSSKQNILQSHLTKDQHTLQLSAWVIWRVSNPHRFTLATTNSKDSIEQQIFSVINKSLSSRIKTLLFKTIVTGALAKDHFRWIDTLNIELMSQGIEIKDAGISRIVFPSWFYEVTYQNMIGKSSQLTRDLTSGLNVDVRLLSNLQTHLQNTVLKKSYNQAQKQREAADLRLIHAYAKKYKSGKS